LNAPTNNYILFGCAGINSALLLNYCLWFVGASTIAAWLCIPLVVFGFLYLSFCVFRQKLSLWPIPVFFLVLLLISLSTAAVAWDARSIWLFHAKRIFLDENLFAQLDNYAPWSHNDYPVIIPAFSASIANLAGYWNEILPKTANIAFLVVPMFLIGVVLQNTVSIIFFIITAIYMCSHYLHDGFVDANIAFMVTSLVLISFKFDDLGRKSQNIVIYIVATSLSILVLMKNEGVLLFGIYCGLLYVYNIYGKFINSARLFCLGVLPLFFFSSWKSYCFMYGIKNELTSSDMLAQVFGRVFNLNDIKLIVSYLLYQEWAVIFAIILGITFFNLKYIRKLNVIFAVFFACIYALCLIFVYLLTPHNLSWHLSASASRVIMPLNMLSVSVLLYIVNAAFFDRFIASLNLRNNYINASETRKP